MTMFASDPYAAGARLPVTAFLNYVAHNGGAGPYADFINEVVRVAPLLPTPLDDSIICAQADYECGTWSSSYWLNDGNAGGIGIYASGVPSPFSVPNNGKLAAHIFVANIWLLLGYGPNIPSVVADVNNVSGLATYFKNVNAAAKDPKRPRVWRIQDLNLTYTSSSGSSECTYACDPTYPQGIVQRFNGAVSEPNTHPAAAPPQNTGGGTTTTTTTVITTSGPDIGKEVVALARKQVGKPYVWATHGPDTFDCSGLVCWCYAQVTGHWITCGSVEQWDSVGWGVARANLYPGDLLFYDTEGTGTAGHVGIWTGDGNVNTQMVNAENPSVGVVYANPFDGYFAPIFLGAKRLYNPPAGVTKTVTVIGHAVTNQSLNVRTGPGGQYDLLMVIAQGTTVNVLGAAKNGYTPISYQYHEGWGATTSLTMVQAPAGGPTTTPSGGVPAPPGTPKPPSTVKAPLTTWKTAAIIVPHTTFGGVDYTMPQTEYAKATALLANIPGRVAQLSGNRCKVSQAFYYRTDPVTTATALPDGTHYVGPNDVTVTLAFINAAGYDHVFVFWPDEGIHSSDYAITLPGAGGGYTAMKVFDTSAWSGKAESDESIRQFMLEVGYVFGARNACRFPDLLNPAKYSSKGNLDYGDATNGLANFLQDTMTGQLVEKSSGLAYGVSNSAWKGGPPVTANTAAGPSRPTDLPDDAVAFPRAVDTTSVQAGDVLLVTARAGVPFSATATGAVLGYVPAGTRLVCLSPLQQVVGGVTLTNVTGRYGAGWVPLGFEDVTTAYPDWCLNGRLDDDLHGVVANATTMDLTRAFAGESFTAMAATWGLSQFEGIRFDSGTSLGLPGGRTVVAVAELCGVGALDAVTCRLWSHRGPAVDGEALTGYEDVHLGRTVTLAPDAWQRVVVPAVMEDPTVPLQKIELHLVNGAPLKQVWHAQNVRFVDVG